MHHQRMIDAVHHQMQVSFYFDYLYDFLMHLFFQSIPMLLSHLIIYYKVLHELLKQNPHLPVDVNVVVKLFCNTTT